MTLLARAKFEYYGWEGGPGVSVLHFSEGTAGGSAWGQAIVDGLYDELFALQGDLSPSLAPGCFIQALPELSIIDSATGGLVDVKVPSDAPDASGSIATAGDISRGTQALFQFGTDKIVNGRRLKGRMFFGPLQAAALNNSGDITAGALVTWPDFWTSLISGLGVRLAAYHRPTSPGANDGDWGDVTNVRVRTKPTHLRSRLY
jgi:hypothetical protein